MLFWRNRCFNQIKKVVGPSNMKLFKYFLNKLKLKEVMMGKVMIVRTVRATTSQSVRAKVCSL